MVKAKAQAPAGGGTAVSTAPNAPQAGTGEHPVGAPPAAPAMPEGTDKPKKEKKIKEKSKKRSDFPGPTGWVDWCEYKKQRCLKKATKLTEQAQVWETNKQGEDVAKNEKKVKKLQAMQKKVAATLAELKALGIDISKLNLETA